MVRLLVADATRPPNIFVPTGTASQRNMLSLRVPSVCVASSEMKLRDESPARSSAGIAHRESSPSSGDLRSRVVARSGDRPQREDCDPSDDMELPPAEMRRPQNPITPTPPKTHPP